MRLFCDQCGTEFGAATLKANNKFCSLCGKELSDHIKQHSKTLFDTSAPRIADDDHNRTNVDLDGETGNRVSQENRVKYTEEDHESRLVWWHSYVTGSVRGVCAVCGF